MSRKRLGAGLPPNGQQQAKRHPSEPLLGATLYNASDLANVLDLDEEQLRGISTTALLAGNGRLFAQDAAVAREDPAGTYALSRPVPRLDYFISHAWRTARWPKFLCLLFYFNFNVSLGAYALGAYLAFWWAVIGFDSLPDVFIFPPTNLAFDASKIGSTWICTLVSVLSLVVALLTAHWWRPKSCFLDVCCIDQMDVSNKAKGISSLGALLDRSDRMVVVLDEHYMSRMWCIFELAAFAKRSSMARCDLVPLHMALQRAALTVVVIVYPLITAALTPIFNYLPKDAGMALYLPLFAVTLAPPYALLLYAINQGRGTTLALRRLKDFKLDNVECYSASDREAIVSLIARWFADVSAIDDSMDEARRQAIGVHQFEQFIRRDVVAKLQETLGDNEVLPEFSLLFLLTIGGAWALDMMTVPEFTLYFVIPHAVQNFTVYLVGGPIFGWGAARAADATFHAQQKWNWPACPAYMFVGIPVMIFFFGLALLTTIFTNPYGFFVNSDTAIGEFTFPDDGLEPFGRAMLKLQIVSLIFGCILVLSKK